MDGWCDSCRKNPFPEGRCCAGDSLDVYTTLREAVKYATKMHVGQKRKNSLGEDYIVHPIEVMLILFENGVKNEDILVAAVLHDVVEDTPATLDDISLKFGTEVATIVAEVSDDKSLPKAMRKRKQMDDIGDKSLAARAIKIADKISNTKDLFIDPPKHWTDLDIFGYIAWSDKVCNNAIIMGGIPAELCGLAQDHFIKINHHPDILDSYFKNM